MSKTKTFENNLAELADIIKKMEQNDVGLEESLKLYENGIKMTRECQSIIENAEKKIESLMDQHNN